MYFKVKGNGPDVILLHGWLQDHRSLNLIGNQLESKYTVYQVDLPGFGNTPLEVPYDIDDYVENLQIFILKNKIKNPILIGHSFGCRIIARYVLKYPVEKIILIDAAGLLNRKLDYYLKVYSYKFIRKVLEIFKQKQLIDKLRNKVGSTDYLQSDVMLKEVMKKTQTNETKNLKKIKVETLLIWGENDEITPLKMAKKFNDLIEKSGLAVIKNSGHFPFIDNPYMFLEVINNYLL